MDSAQKYRSHLFTLRLWQEPLNPEQMEIRFKVQHVLSGEVRYFRGWPLLIEFVMSFVQNETGNIEDMAN